MDLSIGLFGGGIVGGGVYEIIQRLQAHQQNQKEQKENANLSLSSSLSSSLTQRERKIHIRKICVRDREKKRDFVINEETLIVTDYNGENDRNRERERERERD